MKEFIVNDYITLKLESRRTNIYINGEYFRQCKFLLLDIPISKINSFEDIESIDEAVEKINPIQRDHGILFNKGRIPPDIAFWGHCSNLQVWSEENHNPKFIHYNLAFPLLKKLTDAGDLRAKQIFKEEIAKRFNNGHKSVITFLLEGNYLSYLTQEESEIIEYINNKKLRESLDELHEKFGESLKLERYLLNTFLEQGNSKIKDLIIENTFKSLTLEAFNKLFNIDDITLLFYYLPKQRTVPF